LAGDEAEPDSESTVGRERALRNDSGEDLSYTLIWLNPAGECHEQTAKQISAFPLLPVAVTAFFPERGPID
ncbi:hypothetical protein, partial [Pseudomonas sp. GM84]|uniref:hypothetical protein n=1 Tax=Pseudomonas sp. GM84 TaxID=1144340 RepID=UPI001EE6844C